MTETPGRLRWEPLSSGPELGYTVFGQWLFQVYKPSDDADSTEQALMSYLPGQTGEYWYGEDRGKLKAKAEEMLTEFISSLGAVFPDALRKAVSTMRDDKHQLAADHEESGHDWQTERCYGAVEALDWVLSIAGQVTPQGEAGDGKAGQPEAPAAKPPVLTSKYVFNVLCDAGFTPWGNGEPGFTTGWYMDAITVDHVGADLPVHGPLEGPRAIVADYSQTLFAAGFDTHVTVNTVLVRKRAPGTSPATAGKE